MPQADSHASTAMPVDRSARAAPSVAKKSVAANSTPLLNDGTDLNHEPASKQECEMSRRSALKTAVGVAGFELAAHSTKAFAARRVRNPSQENTIVPDPIFAALEQYRIATLEVIAAHKPYATAEEKLPIRYFSGPKVMLRFSPDESASSHEEIDNYFDKMVEHTLFATVDYKDEAQAKMLAPISQDRARMHAEFDVAQRDCAKARAEAGYDVAETRVKASYRGEDAALEQIATTAPTTLSGMAALSAFLRTVLESDECDDYESAARISANLFEAAASLASEPIPQVMPYRYFPDNWAE